MSKRPASSQVIVIDDSSNSSSSSNGASQLNIQQHALLASEESLRATFDLFLAALLAGDGDRHQRFCDTFPYTVARLRDAWNELVAQSRTHAQNLLFEALVFVDASQPWGNQTSVDALLAKLEPQQARDAMETRLGVHARTNKSRTGQRPAILLMSRLAGPQLSGAHGELPICSLHDMDTATHILFGMAVGNLFADATTLRTKQWAENTHAWLQNLALQALRYHQLCLVAHELLAEGLRQGDKYVVKSLLVASPEAFRIDILVHHDRQELFDVLLSDHRSNEDEFLVQVLDSLWFSEAEELRPVRHAVHHDIHAALRDSGASLYAYQQVVLQWALERERMSTVVGKRFPGGILALRPGMGKTRIAEALTLVRDNTLARPTLVLVPLGVIEDWRKENVGAFNNKLRIRVLHNDYDAKRSAGVALVDLLTQWLDDRDTDVVLTTTQTLIAHFYPKQTKQATPEELDAQAKQLARHVPLLGRFGRLIIDEMHLLSNAKGKLYKKLTALVERIPSRWGLTGTVFRNRRIDLDAQLELLGLRRTPGGLSGSPDLLRHLYMLDYGPETVERKERLVIVKETPLDKLEWDLYSQIYQYGRTLFRRGAFDALSGAMTRMRQAAIDMSLIPQETINEMRASAGLPRTGSGSGSLFSLLGGATNMFSAWGTAGAPTVSSKLRAVITLMRQIVLTHPDDKILVFCSFAQVLDKLKGLLQTPDIPWSVGIYNGKASTRERRRLRERFETQPDMKALFITYTAGGAGLNLQVASHVIEIDPCFNDATLDQAEARAWRVGQKKMVRIYRFLAPNTYEMRMEAIRAEKAEDWENMQQGVGNGKARRSRGVVAPAVVIIEEEPEEGGEEEGAEEPERVPMSFMERIFGELWG
jgi:superfamily II DNA or RNA helicase